MEIKGGALIKSEKGFSLMEVMVAIALMGIVSVAFFSAIATASKVVFIANERAAAESLARTEMEYVRSQQYSAVPWAYELPSGTPPAAPPDWWDNDNPHTLPEGYDGYIVRVSAEGLSEPNIDNEIQKITVTIKHLDKPEVVELEGYRSMR